MFGTEDEPQSPLFGIRSGQARGGRTKIIQNGGWYSSSGDKLGWGDLSAEDFQRISGDLESDELIIILDEEDSFWKFKEHPDLSMEAPGIDYVAKHARYVIARNQFWRVEKNLGTGTFERGGLQFKILESKAVKPLILLSVAGTPI
jgi:hypothetical protein